MKLTDYVTEFIAKRGTKKVFLVTGGAIAHMVDSIGRRSQEVGDIDYIVVQHEQVAAMAAENYSRITRTMGVACATSGPGATNLITGICDCFFDSIPVVFITGQVNVKDSVNSVAGPLKPRQVGFQETDIVNIVKSITKYAVWVFDPDRIRYELEKAYYIASHGRPGPVLVDLPMNVQVSDVDPEKLEGFIPEEETDSNIDSPESVYLKVKETLNLLSQSKRPVLLLGGGIKHARSEKSASDLAEKLGIPVVVSWAGFDILPHSHPLFCGAIGVYSNRGANLTVQNSDFLLSLGSRLDSRQTSRWFAREAKIVMVDIDKSEFAKFTEMEPVIKISADIKDVLKLLHEGLKNISLPEIDVWKEITKSWYRKYPAVLLEYFKEPTINAYAFLKTLSDMAGEDEIIVVDEGGHLVWTMQSWEVKKGQKYISTFANSPMGYALPGAIGAAAAAPGKQVICIDGDGGIQMNIQEFQTLAHYRFPVKLFIMNNRCMGIMNQFQDNYFEGRRHGTAPEGGYSMPDFVKVAHAYGIDALTVQHPEEMESAIEKVLASDGPIVCNVLVNEKQEILPRLEFGRPLEDMRPYLSDEEFLSNMIVTAMPRVKTKKGWQKV
ncbi:MAG: thiamine pyrophosphate-binding protein [Candidatus Taylorbacteria bacterium]|nr:thiamine pyrophosphate-binding protein [Candidatus Taylorbacteria bacterium]